MECINHILYTLLSVSSFYHALDINGSFNLQRGSICRVYGDIRQKYGDLEDDEDLVRIFTEVLERREELEARGLEDQALAVETCTADDASLGYTPRHASMGT